MELCIVGCSSWQRFTELVSWCRALYPWGPFGDMSLQGFLIIHLPLQINYFPISTSFLHNKLKVPYHLCCGKFYKSTTSINGPHEFTTMRGCFREVLLYMSVCVCVCVCVCVKSAMDLYLVTYNINMSCSIVKLSK